MKRYEPSLVYPIALTRPVSEGGVDETSGEDEEMKPAYSKSPRGNENGGL
jgi:hypothetical protein